MDFQALAFPSEIGDSPAPLKAYWEPTIERVFGTLLRGNRITIHQALEGRDYRIEGVAELTLEAHTPGRHETTGRMLSVVAGKGFASSLRLRRPRNPRTLGYERGPGGREFVNVVGILRS
jgi:hypothetical protein